MKGINVTYNTKKSSYLHIKPFSKTDTVEKVPASSDLGAGHLLVADGADVVKALEFLPGRLRQRVDLFDSRASLNKNAPAGSRLAPNVEICVDAHHDGSYGAARLKHQDPSAVEEEEYAKAELHLKHTIKIENLNFKW